MGKDIPKYTDVKKTLLTLCTSQFKGTDMPGGVAERAARGAQVPNHLRKKIVMMPVLRKFYFILHFQP